MINNRLSTESWWVSRQTVESRVAHSCLPGSRRKCPSTVALYSVHDPRALVSGSPTFCGLQQDVLLLNIHSCFHLSAPWSLRLEHPPHQTQSHPAPWSIWIPLALHSHFSTDTSLSLFSGQPQPRCSVWKSASHSPKMLIILSQKTWVCFNCSLIVVYYLTLVLGEKASWNQRACLRCFHILGAWRGAAQNYNLKL